MPKKPTTIYLVTSGEYSDYHIDAVFSTREKAQAFIAYENRRDPHALRTGDEPQIEEWELDWVSDQLARGLCYYYVDFRDINQGDATVHAASPEAHDSEDTCQPWRDRPASYWAYLWAKDEQAALKIANERRVAFLLRREQGEQHEQHEQEGA